MAIAIQDLPSVVAGSSSSALDGFPQAVVGADFSNTVPSTIVTLGGALPEALTFNAGGLLDAARVGTTQNAALSFNVTPTVATTTTDTTAATAVAETPAAPTTPATTAPIVATAAETTVAATDTITPLAINPFADPATQALADFVVNPVYAGLATAIYLNAAIYRSQQVSAAALVNTVDLPEPVSAPIAITSATTNSNQEPTENWRNANAYQQQAGGMATPRPHIVEVA